MEFCRENDDFLVVINRNIFFVIDFNFENRFVIEEIRIEVDYNFLKQFEFDFNFLKLNKFYNVSNREVLVVCVF